MESEVQKPYLNVKETATLLGVHQNTIRSWVSKGILRSSRVPGTTANRFSREEVERLQKERGSRTSSVAPLLRRDSLELIGPTELDRWAASQDSKGAFPELVSRLLAATGGLTNVEVRSHEGTSGFGWDGSATSTGSTFLPAGELRFELGTDKDAKHKAQHDYQKRVDALPKDANVIFIFATPRNWAGSRDWAEGRAEEHKFIDVRAFDAHRISEWIRSTPAVHYWISERLGYQPRDAKTIERWRSDFDDRVTLKLPPPFFLAGRTTEAEKLRELLTSAEQSVVSIHAPWRDEAIAFVHAAAANQPDLLQRIVLVEENAVWDRLVHSAAPLTLIPMFDGPNVNLATRRGHRVILISTADEPMQGPDISLPKVDPHSAGQALRDANDGIKDEYRLVALARRSLSALVRSYAQVRRLKEPKWAANPTQSEVLTPLLLAGGWTPNEPDQEAVSKLVVKTPDEIERLLRQLSRGADAPFVLSGEIWRIASPLELGLLLSPKLTARDMRGWSDLAFEVLLDPDPYQGMGTLERLSVQMKGPRPPEYSNSLRKGLAESMALLASLDSEFPSPHSGQSWVDGTIQRLLGAAFEDSSGAKLERISDVLPLLAEAAPQVFLDFVESDLQKDEPFVMTLFKDTAPDVFGSSSPHPALLWSLETLCWSAELFPRAAGALADLARKDPGGRLSNRPLESLQNVSAGWLRQSGASVQDKLSLLEGLLTRDPVIGWKALLAVWPSSHATAFSPHTPVFRDWVTGSRSVSFADWERFVDGLVDFALRYSGANAARWSDLVKGADNLPARQRVQLIKELGSDERISSWSSEERFDVWSAMRDEIDRHEEYADANWAMPDDELHAWRKIAAALAPDVDPRRYSHLFDWRTRAGNLRHGDEGFDAELHRLQLEAVRDVLAQGTDQLTTLIADVKIPARVGGLLAEIADASSDEAIVGWLESEDSNLSAAAHAFGAGRVSFNGLAWLRTTLSWFKEGSEVRNRLICLVTPTRDNWAFVAEFGEDLESTYWSRLNPYAIEEDDSEDVVNRMIEHGQGWSAITVLSNSVAGKKASPDVELIKRAFGALGSGTSPIADRTMASYYVESLLKYMEQFVPDDPDLPGLEFTFFDFLHEHDPSNALFRLLNNSPSEFVVIVKLVFRGEGESDRRLTADESARAQIAYSVLREWPTVPGQELDGSVDAEILGQWIRASRLLLADSGRISIGDEVIGEILSASPSDSDDIWPAKPIRDLIETIGSTRLETGLQIGLANRRGVTTRGAFDGGRQERDAEKRYRDMAPRVTTKWPRTARMLRSIADSYRAEADRNDREADRRGDDV
ncbi:helix-turn-helix domain-containing protein [Subtercola vilae]|nr:helix-turn-helix domain-containing protein [Subtercola vilae]